MDDDIELANKTVQQKSSKSFVRLDKESSDEDEDESESEDEEEALMDVSSSESSDEESSDDEEEEEEEEEEFLEDSEDDEAGLLRAMKAQKKKLEYAATEESRGTFRRFRRGKGFRGRRRRWCEREEEAGFLRRRGD